ncbi:hypothetical protein [Paraburkholderia sp. BCC1886]|uniref:hypothetical protein n=1 Tax=Paraburkholderia sp. BCC1886 TaxID=2562670 RepID=UPI0021B3E0DE|nr:hypothetical protein [Paraburkholderia sp. BCC1886]
MNGLAPASGSAPASLEQAGFESRLGAVRGASAMERTGQTGLLAAGGALLAEPGFVEPPYAIKRKAQSVRTMLLALGVVLGIGVAYGAYALFGDSGDTQVSVDDSTTDTIQDARTTTGTIAQSALSTQTQRAATRMITTPQVTLPALPSLPVDQPAPAIPPTPIMALASVAPVKPVVPQFRDVAQAVQTARLALRASDLSTAQAAVAAVQAMQPGNADAQSLSQQLKPAAARRDAALQAAQSCVAQQSWSCARQHANEALVIDSGNETAKALLERVIRETGWAPLDARTAPTAATTVATTVAATAATTAPAVNPTPRTAPSPAPAALQPKNPATGPTPAAQPRPAVGAATGTADANSVEARENTIRNSGWSRPAAGTGSAKAGAASSAP